jgi:hypothetical protein
MLLCIFHGFFGSQFFLLLLISLSLKVFFGLDLEGGEKLLEFRRRHPHRPQGRATMFLGMDDERVDTTSHF